MSQCAGELTQIHGTLLAEEAVDVYCPKMILK